MSRIQFLAGITIMALLGIAGVWLIPRPRPAPAISGHGFWKSITVTDDFTDKTSPAEAYFCDNSGQYQAHIVVEKDLVVVYNGNIKTGAYATKTFAKKAVEAASECK